MNFKFVTWQYLQFAFATGQTFNPDLLIVRIEDRLALVLF